MICQNCGLNNATSHFHSVINGVVTDKYLCSKCAAALKTPSFADDGIFDMLTSFLSDTATVKTDAKKCECCGVTYDVIAKTGKVGCSRCYETFKEELSSTLVRLHGRTNHIGKRLNRDVVQENKSVTIQEKIDNLRKELAQAIKDEQYEKAAVLRDEIKGLEEQK